MKITQPFLKKKVLYSAIASSLTLLAGTAVQAQESGQTSTATKGPSFLEEVTVTARRREENAQDIPVSVTAVSSEDLYRESVSEIDDLTSSIPGVNFTASGGANNTVFSIRGRSRGVFGNALPAVTAYVNEVPLSTWGGNIPTYDMASVQVLKGPQGTLFGRNSTAGAVLVTTQAPEKEFGGQVAVKVGDYNTQVLEAAINLPVVEDNLFVRIAGQVEERDGHTKDMVRPNADDYGNRDRENLRISVLWEPTDSISNLTIYENNKTDERAVPTSPVGYELDNPFSAVNVTPYYAGGPFVAPTGPSFPNLGSGYIIDPTNPTNLIPCNGDPSCDVNAMKARQDAAGVRKSWQDVDASLEQELTSWGNITTVDFDSFTLKNIFGYREVYTYSISDIDGSIFPMIGADNVVNNKQYSNELQISGEALDNALNYIGGLFWLKSEPNGENRLALQLFAQSGIPMTSTFPTPFNGASGPGDFYTDTSKAIFGQVSLDLNHFNAELEGLSVDIGLRHTKDKTENCPVGATNLVDPISDGSECTESRSAEFSKTSYNLGLNYQLTDDVLLYAVTRTGYRAGGVNSPNLGGTLTDFQEFEPETVQDFELGIKSDWTIGDINGRLNASIFRSEYEGVHYALPTANIGQFIDVDGDGDDTNNPSGGLFYDNAGDATVDGIELELIVQLTEGLELALGGSYLDKSFEPDITLPSNWVALVSSGVPIASDEDIEAFVFLGAPDWSYTASLDYTLPVSASLGEVVVSADYFKISDIHYGGTVFAPSYELIDIRVDWLGIMGSSFDAAIFVNNVTDEEAMLGPSSSSPGLGFNSAIYNDPRMWGASVRYTF